MTKEPLFRRPCPPFRNLQPRQAQMRSVLLGPVQCSNIRLGPRRPGSLVFPPIPEVRVADHPRRTTMRDPDLDLSDLLMSRSKPTLSGSTE